MKEDKQRCGELFGHPCDFCWHWPAVCCDNHKDKSQCHRYRKRLAKRCKNDRRKAI